MSGEHHSLFKFGAQYFQYVVNALRAVDGQSPEEWAANEDCSRSEGQGFEDIGAAAYAAIQVYLAAARDGLDNLGEGFNAGKGRVQLSSTVIGDDDACYSPFERQ